MKYKFLSHTGDAKFQAYGETLEEAFQNAALALASLMWNPGEIKDQTQKSVELTAKDREQLLVAFLEEVLFLWGGRQFLLASCRKLDIQEREEGLELKAVLSGDTRPEQYDISGDVKAVTYNEMEIRKNGHWSVQVVVDI